MASRLYWVHRQVFVERVVGPVALAAQDHGTVGLRRRDLLFGGSGGGSLDIFCIVVVGARAGRFIVSSFVPVSPVSIVAASFATRTLGFFRPIFFQPVFAEMTTVTVPFTFFFRACATSVSTRPAESFTVQVKIVL